MLRKRPLKKLWNLFSDVIVFKKNQIIGAANKAKIPVLEAVDNKANNKIKIKGNAKYLNFVILSGFKMICDPKTIIAIANLIAKSFEFAPNATVLTTSSLYSVDSPKPKKILIAGINAPKEYIRRALSRTKLSFWT